MNKRWVAFGAAVVVAIGSGAWWWATQGRSGVWGAGAAQAASKAGADGKKPEVPLEFQPAELIRPERQALPHTLRLSGPLVAPATALVRAKAAGRLLSLRVAEGDRVKAGQLLGTQDQAGDTSRVAERAAMLESARAALAQAQRTQEQNERLAQQSFISSAALDSGRAAVLTAQAQFDAAQAALGTSRVALRDGSIVAPISGIVAKRQALPGEMLSLEQPVLSIVDLARLELAGSVATHEVSRLTPGLPAQVMVEGHEQPVSGRVARIAPAAEPGTRAIGVTIELLNPQETFRAGQYALATVTVADNTQRLVLPRSAVASVGGQNFVWTLSSGKLQRRSVTLGRQDDSGGRVELLEGLPADAAVLAVRFDNLREGAPALVQAPGRAPAPAASGLR